MRTKISKNQNNPKPQVLMDPVSIPAGKSFQLLLELGAKRLNEDSDTYGALKTKANCDPVRRMERLSVPSPPPPRPVAPGLRGYLKLQDRPPPEKLSSLQEGGEDGQF